MMRCIRVETDALSGGDQLEKLLLPPGYCGSMAPRPDPRNGRSGRCDPYAIQHVTCRMAFISLLPFASFSIACAVGNTRSSTSRAWALCS